MVYANAAVDQILQNLIEAHRQDASLEQFGALISAQQYLLAYRLVAKYLRPRDRVLDWGVGNGHFSYFLVKAGYCAEGYSFQGLPPVCAPFVSEQYHYRQGNWSEPTILPFPDQRFDGVVSIGVLEHVRETGGEEIASLKEIYRILKPNGVFICFHLPNRYSWIEYAARVVKKWSHEYRYTTKEITAMSAMAGFDLLEMRRYAILPRNIWSSLPQVLGNSLTLAQLYNGIDELSSLLLSPLCQNYFFVARKPSNSPDDDEVSLLI